MKLKPEIYLNIFKKTGLTYQLSMIKMETVKFKKAYKIYLLGSNFITIMVC